MLSKLPTHIICHYSEIGLKGQNRNYFEKKLKENIKYILEVNAPDSFVSIQRLRGRFLIELTESGQNSIAEIRDTLINVFGLAYFAFAYESKPDLDIIKSDSLNLMKRLEFNTFRVTARRVDSKFPHTSQELNEYVGEVIFEKMNKSVNLKYPEATCFIDVLDEGTFLFTEKIQSAKGLPIGVSGKAIVMLSGGIDSPVAAYYAMKRGMHVIYVHFHSVPLVSEASVEKVRDTVAILKKYQQKSKLYLMKFAAIQQQIMVDCNEKLRVVLYRRYMMKIAEKVAELENAKAIYTGEALGQVASQTIENITVVEESVNLPIMRPLIGFDKLEIIAKAIEIGTYEISILPHEDCCTLYVPKHPATKARLIDVLQNEARLDSESLINDSLETTEIVIID
ncbi:MAG: tRNA 4-thiouridine(8) synthase ThiI [Candidatus Marinimicrobia bacterium]|nr:tRNA 4-thiouridine(8) synthase ThiI [Candidatus Neomarinimicrobiota bacterium]